MTNTVPALARCDALLGRGDDGSDSLTVFAGPPLLAGDRSLD
jgi:hypothetical protein